MCVLFFARESGGAAGRFYEILKTLVSDKAKLEVFRTPKDLSGRLRRPSGFKEGIAVLFVKSREELLELQSLGELLCDLRIILLLPDDEEETIAAGHLLRPRFLSYADGDFREVAAVLYKMLKLSAAGKTGENRFFSQFAND